MGDGEIAPKIIYLDIDGTRKVVEAEPGMTIMEAAVDNGVRGIIAECGGACACATCHAYVSEKWLDRLPPPGELEDGMLDAAMDRRPNSRLTCQLEVTDMLDGIELEVAQNEH